jgi:hypothetical protein
LDLSVRHQFQCTSAGQARERPRTVRGLFVERFRSSCGLHPEETN